MSERGPGGNAGTLSTQVLVIGSGAGGATTAAALAERGYTVTILEEGADIDTSRMATNSPEAIARLYRNGGITPILGRPSIAYVEGRCVGGSTEVNSAFWHRLPAHCYHRWRSDTLLSDFTQEGMEPYFDALERDLSVSYLDTAEMPRSSEVFRRGIESMKWQYTEVPRCQKRNDGVSPFAPGQKQSMQRTLIPRARAAGARLLADCKAWRLQREGDRITGAIVTSAGGDDFTIRADWIFVCCGAVHSAALLRRSGVTRNVGDNLCIHPMIKAAALFDEHIGAHREMLPIYQVKEFQPNIAIGGSVFTPGFLAMLLADNWEASHDVMRRLDRMALYYAGTRGMSRGTIRVLPGLRDGVVVRYRLTEADQRNISHGLAHLGEILFAAGARAVYPSLRAQPVLKSADQCRGFLKEPIPLAAMSLSTVHAFSSCPMGENPDVCATDSFGKVHGLRNLFINDASVLPDSPGVNPQGTIMAIALRNVDRFDERRRHERNAARRAVSTARAKPAFLVTGAPGWLGTRLLEALLVGLPKVPGLEVRDPDRVVRALVHPRADPAALTEISPHLQCTSGDINDPGALRELCDGAENAVLFHVAGVVHPQRRVAELDHVNVDGTRALLEAARAAGVRRLVAVSSNSPFGFNPRPGHLFDEASPYHPYMGYGRSKRRMEELVFAANGGGLDTVIVRPPWFYGPHQPPRQTQFFRMIRDGRFPILGDGTQRRSMAHVDNLCQGLWLAAHAAAASGRAYWIADERPYTINEIVTTVRTVLTEEFGVTCARRQLRLPALVGSLAGVADGLLQAAGLYEQRIHVLGELSHEIACSIDTAKRELGYAPRVGLRDGMAESIRWCLANGYHL